MTQPITAKELGRSLTMRMRSGNVDSQTPLEVFLVGTPLTHKTTLPQLVGILKSLKLRFTVRFYEWKIGGSLPMTNTFPLTRTTGKININETSL